MQVLRLAAVAMWRLQFRPARGIDQGHLGGRAKAHANRGGTSIALAAQIRRRQLVSQAAGPRRLAEQLLEPSQVSEVYDLFAGSPGRRDVQVDLMIEGRI